MENSKTPSSRPVPTSSTQDLHSTAVSTAIFLTGALLLLHIFKLAFLCELVNRTFLKWSVQC